MCGGGENSYGRDDDGDERISLREILRDMTDGGGRGTSGDTFEGALSGISNALGATPRGSDREPTGVAKFASGVTGIGGRANPTSGALLGALTGGIPGALMGYSAARGRNAVEDAGGLRSLFGRQTADSTMGDTSTATGAAVEQSLRPQGRPAQGTPTARSSSSQGSVEPETPVVAPEPTVPLTMSESAAEGGFQPIPNPNYDPTDPMSPMYLSNPTYAQLLAYRDSGTVPTLARGGMLSMATALGASDQTAQQGLMNSASPLQQYGGYLEQEYGEPGFEQKKDQFLQEVQQREQQTFGDGTPFAAPREGFLGAANPHGLGAAGYRNQTQAFPGVATPQPFPSNMLQGYAEGGEVTGGNEKTAISDAVSAIKGELSEVRASIVLGKFLERYGEDALRNLVDTVQSGELDDTVDRFANGEAGEVRGPGDGSGVDDKVPASLDGQQDVLLADGEFVLRKKTADALQKKYGGGFLDAVNKAENDAPRTMQQYMARN